MVGRLARDAGALSVGVVTRPFQFEGRKRRKQADEGIAALRDSVDTLIVIPNDRLLATAERNTSMVEAFARADDILLQAVRGISDLVTVHGLINLDFADVRTIMSEMGMAIMGSGTARGETRRFLHRVDLALRRFLGLRHGCEATEMTSTEVVAMLRRFAGDEAEGERIDAWPADCDRLRLGDAATKSVGSRCPQEP